MCGSCSLYLGEQGRRVTLTPGVLDERLDVLRFALSGFDKAAVLDQELLLLEPGFKLDKQRVGARAFLYCLDQPGQRLA